MNLQITAIFSDADRASDTSLTHYQPLNLDSFAMATLSKPQVVSMVEQGTKVFVVNADGEQIPCAINTKNLIDGTAEKWVQGQDGESWTDDIVSLPHLQDINGATMIRKYTMRGSRND